MTKIGMLVGLLCLAAGQAYSFGQEGGPINKKVGNFKHRPDASTSYEDWMVNDDGSITLIGPYFQFEGKNRLPIILGYCGDYYCGNPGQDDNTGGSPDGTCKFFGLGKFVVEEVKPGHGAAAVIGENGHLEGYAHPYQGSILHDYYQVVDTLTCRPYEQ